MRLITVTCTMIEKWHVWSSLSSSSKWTSRHMDLIGISIGGEVDVNPAFSWNLGLGKGRGEQNKTIWFILAAPLKAWVSLVYLFIWQILLVTGYLLCAGTFLGHMAVNMEKGLILPVFLSSEICVVGIWNLTFHIHSPVFGHSNDFSSRFTLFSTLNPLGLKDGFMTQSYPSQHSPPWPWTHDPSWSNQSKSQDSCRS